MSYEEVQANLWKYGTAILLSVILVSPVATYTASTEAHQMQELPESLKTVSQLAFHDPITITADSDFETQGWPGSGTPEDPYVIQGFYFNQTHSSIKINGTSAHFLITQCEFKSVYQVGKPKYSHYLGYAALYLKDVQNGEVMNCTFSNLYTGVEIKSSSDIEFAFNTVKNSELGMYVWFGGVNVYVHHNTFVDNGFMGLHTSGTPTLVNDNQFIGNSIGLYASYLSSITNNTFVNDGIYVSNAGLVDLSSNLVNGLAIGYFYGLSDITIEGGDYGQLILVNCNNVSVKNVEITNTSIPYQFFGGFNCSLANSVSRDCSFGVVSQSVNMTIQGNKFLDCSRDGISDNSQNAVIRNNIVSNCNGSGINFQFHLEAIVQNNTLINCGFYNLLPDYDYGTNRVNGGVVAYLEYLSNAAIDGSIYGQLILSDCSNITLMDISFRGLMYGLALYDCYNCTIVDSEIIDSTLMGIYAYNCESITIENSNISDNGDGGIVLYNSNSACILGNQITNNRGIGVYAHQSYYANISFNVISDGHPDHELSFSHDDDIPCAGIRGYNEYYLTASYNEIYDNQGYGIALNQCHAVRIFGNKIGWNTEGNARDDYNRNHWDSETSYVLEDYEGIGNFWSDYNGTGPYVINGDSMDRWPVLWEFDPPSIVPLDNIHFDDPTRRRLVNWTAQDLAPHRFIAYLDGSEYDTAPWDGSEITVDVTDLEIGQYNLTLKLMDKIGNQASDQITLTIEVAYTGNDVVYTGSTTPFTIGEDSIQIIFAIGVGGVAVLALVGADLYLRKRNAV